jgi:ABC-type transport system involved in multi-copper enzyme maturation permease subunit
MVLTRRPFIGLLLLALLPFVIRAVQIYVATNVPQAQALLRITPATFRDFLAGQNIFVFFITVYVGAGLIANDKRTNALQIYLSRPLTRGEYIAGKLAILLVFLLLVTWVPAMTLLVLQLLFSGSVEFLRANLYLPFAITAFSFTIAGTASITMLALSSLSKSGRYVGILYTLLIFLSQALYGVLRIATGDTYVAWVSFSANLVQVGAAAFGLAPDYRTPWAVSLAVIAGLVLASCLVLERRVRAVEIVT